FLGDDGHAVVGRGRGPAVRKRIASPAEGKITEALGKLQKFEAGSFVLDRLHWRAFPFGGRLEQRRERRGDRPGADEGCRRGQKRSTRQRRLRNPAHESPRVKEVGGMEPDSAVE